MKLTYVISLLLFFLHASFCIGQCFVQLDGRDLFLFSPVKTKLTLYKPLLGKEWGDSTLRNCAGLGPVIHKRVAPGYVIAKNTAIYAAHSGMLRTFTTGGNDEPNDACWIDGLDFSTAYFHVYFNVSSNKYVYAGQRIGTVIPRKDTTFFYFGIRQAKPVQPIMKRVGLPVTGDKDCSCYIDPVWPEYFVNPTDWHISWEYNESEPQTSIKINIKPSWAGRWSFDNGRTWLQGGEAISGLPQKYYKIIFQEKEGWATPLPIELTTSEAKNNYEFDVEYKQEINNSNNISSTNNQIDSASFLLAIDSIRQVAYDSSYKGVKTDVYRTFQDSLNKKLNKIESEQQNALRSNKVLYVVMPLALLLGLTIIAFYFQYQRLKKGKRHVEELQKELHHRVRNNLSIISGLIDASASSKSTNSIPAKDLESRIQSISYVHEQLYHQEDITSLNLQEFIEKLCENLIQTYSNSSSVCYFVYAPLMIDVKFATQIALIFTEVVTNSLKHGIIKGQVLEIKVEASLLKDKKVQMVISDNGTGYPEDFENSNSYGIKMIKGLVKQIKAEIFFEKNNGSVTKLIF